MAEGNGFPGSVSVAVGYDGVRQPVRDSGDHCSYPPCGPDLSANGDAFASGGNRTTHPYVDAAHSGPHPHDATHSVAHRYADGCAD